MPGRSVLVTCVVMATLWTSGSTSDLAAVNPDSLDKTGSHVCTIQKQEPYTVLEAYTFYGRRSSNTWCPSIPPRCTEYFLTSATGYRIATKYRIRDYISCCEGYTPVKTRTYCKPLCQNDCYNDEGNGYCAFPDTCLCNEGHKGKYCESGCDDGEWGPDCSKSCDCGSHGSCDPNNGNCVCHIGWTGAKCDQKCSGGFGMHCIHPCVCENNATCDHVNGKCTCQSGFYGAYCHKKCDATSIDENTCTQTCPCQNGGSCNMDGSCSCQPGFKGEYCSLPCDQYHWGVQCQNVCRCENGVCDQNTGECQCYFGYGGETCNFLCKPGYFGSLCQNECPCKNNGQCYVSVSRSHWSGEIRCNCTQTGYHGIKCTQRDCPDNQWTVNGVCMNCSCPWETTDSCHPYTGECQCKSGYTGDQCTVRCEMPFWGKDCQEVCQCPHGDCHYKTGECTQCYHGYRGENCDKKCKQGSYGLNCSQTCQCENNAPCHVKMGFCNCTAGFEGISCSEPCESTQWGPFCVNNCTCDVDTSICSPYDGTCQCRSGYYGSDCQLMCPDWMFGYQCRHDCDCDQSGSQSCHHRTGDCICQPGYSGFRCDLASGDANVVGGQTQDDNESVGAPYIALIVIGSLILLAIVFLLAFYLRRRRNTDKNDQTAVHYDNTDTLPVQTVIPNGAPVQMHNPIYAQENMHNEKRYPHLSQKRPLPEPQTRRCSGESFDSIVEEKLRNASANQRPESSHYQDIDDDRYTTLKSINGASGTSSDINKNLYVDNTESKLADKFATSQIDPPERPLPYDKKDGGSHSNQAFGTEQEDEIDIKHWGSDVDTLPSTTYTNTPSDMVFNRNSNNNDNSSNDNADPQPWVQFSEDTHA